MGWIGAISIFLKTHLFVSYLISAIGGAVVTWFWSQMLHSKIRALYPPEQHGLQVDRVWWIPILIGMFERAIIQTLLIWVPASVGGFLGGWMIVKAAGSWGTLSAGTNAGRAYFFAGLLGSAASISIALVVGVFSASYFP